ncbi:hypothetical protein DFH09DRAFT_17039 [Mycena vulgaris]|nr:hypothetical protein DFH09DRAFT_17039 [Mycena vulgaris]
MGPSTSPGTLLRSLFWSLFVLSAVAGPADVYPRATNSNSASPPTSATSSTSLPSSSSSGFSSSSGSSGSSSSSSASSSTFSKSSSSSSSSIAVSISSSPPSSISSSSRSSLTPVTTTITTSSSSSSFSSVSTSTKSTSKTSAALVVTPTETPGPTSTLDVSPDIATNSDSDPTPTVSAGVNHVKAASTGFWNNKGAVGGTFTVVALVVVGILVAVGMVIRRRAASHNSARDTFFDTKNPPPADRVERYSSGPSMVSLGNEPMDAHAMTGPNYGATDQYLVDTADYNVSYPPGASYPAHTDVAYAPTADHTTPAAQQYYTPTADQHYPSAPAEHDAYYAEGNAYDNYQQYYTAEAAAGDNGYSVSPADYRPSLSPHPYSHPSHAAAAPPSALRDFAGRDSAYQQSIDSFYGAAGTAV